MGTNIVRYLIVKNNVVTDVTNHVAGVPMQQSQETMTGHSPSMKNDLTATKGAHSLPDRNTDSRG